MVKKKCQVCNSKFEDNEFTVCRGCCETVKKPLIDPVLAYMATYIHRSSDIKLRIAVSSFYNEDVIEVAKKLLLQGIDHLKINIGEAGKDRHNSAQRSAKEANVEDIMQILKVLDKHTGDDKPQICVEDITKLPPAAPEAAGSAMSLYEVIAEQKKALRTLQETVTSIRADVMANTKDVAAMKELNKTKAVNPRSYASAIGQVQQPQHAAGPSVHAAGPNVQAKETDVINIDTNDGYSLVQSKASRKQDARNRKQQTRKNGSAEASDSLAAGPTDFLVQLTNVSPSVETETLERYIKEKDSEIEVLEVSDTTSMGWETKRFLIKFKMTEYEKVMGEDFWPRRIYYKRWYPERRRIDRQGTNNTLQ